MICRPCSAGVANPAPIISTFLLEPTLQEAIRMDGICTVVDSRHISKHLDEKEKTGVDNEACAQVAYADRIIVNKVDLVGAGELAELKQRITGINRLAVMQEATKSVVPIEYVLGIGGYALAEVSASVRFFIAMHHPWFVMFPSCNTHAHAQLSARSGLLSITCTVRSAHALRQKRACF